MIKGIDHVQLAVPRGEEAQARWFYGRLLGLREVVKPEPLVSRGGAWFEGPGTIVHLGVQDNFIPAAKAHPAFIVSNLGALRLALQEAGIEITPDDILPDVFRFYAKDPFGNRIEFLQDGDGFSQR